VNEESKIVLIHGGTASLVRPVATALLSRGATVALFDPEWSGRSAALADELKPASGERLLDLTPLVAANDDHHLPLRVLAERCGPADAVVQLYAPTGDANEATLIDHTRRVDARITAAAAHMAQSGSHGIIINQFLLATLFVDHPAMSTFCLARGAIASLTRAACVRYGKAGVRVVGLFVGLLNLPEARALASERVNAATTPLGRWIEPEEVAEAIAFLALESGYISGQMLILDGGMTAGVNGI